MKLNNKINKIVFIGMGLINSSLARDLKKYNFYNTSTAYSRRASTREKIKKLNLVDLVESDCKKAVVDADLIIIGVPVDSYEAILKKIITYIKPGAIITDVGSVKKEVIKYAASGFRDFTRIAASDPIMWRDIVLLNKKSILKMLEYFKKDLGKLEQAIKNNNDIFLLKLFSKTRKIRKDIIK